MKKIIIFFNLIFFIILVPILSNASNITDNSEILLNEKAIDKKVIDNKENTYISVQKGKQITIKANEDIQGIYIVYEFSSKKGSIKNNNETIPVGENGFLHEYVDLTEKFKNVTQLELSYEEDVKIADIYVLGKGELPDFVEVWNKPCDKADLLLFSTHSDDEQLFFLGLLPTYVAKGANVQVVYFAHHNDTPSRLHEQIHGLYAVGIRNYPITGYIPDAYSESLEAAMSNMKKAGISEEDAIKFQVEAIRRFKPQVVVGHDEKGEYGHGQHILCTYILEKALNLAADENFDKETANKYGIWQIKKLYLHLYEKNEITMDYDTPLEYFGGKTAYEVSKIGYSKHISQQWTWFTRWINGKNNSYTKATDIEDYSPLKYGLYYTEVGEDIKKNDMLENITYYKDQESPKQEEPQKQETQNEIEEPKQEEAKKSPKKFLIIGGGIILFLIFINAPIVKPKKGKHSKGRRKK